MASPIPPAAPPPAAPPPPGPLKTATSAPTRKVAAGGLGGAVSVIVIAIIRYTLHTDIDPILASAITTVVSFGVAYFVPPGASDTPVPA